MAIETFENVLARDGVNVSAIAGLASIYQNTNELDKARDFYLQQAQITPDNPVAHYSVGSLNWMIVFDKTVERPVEELSDLIEEGQQYLDTALALDENYEDAMSYKNLPVSPGRRADRRRSGSRGPGCSGSRSRGKESRNPRDG